MTANRCCSVIRNGEIKGAVLKPQNLNNGNFGLNSPFYMKNSLEKIILQATIGENNFVQELFYMTDFTIRQEQLFFSLTMYEKEMKNTKHKLNKRSS